MSALTPITYENAVIMLRSKIIEYTGLPNEFVLNGDSIYGPDIYNMLQSKIGESPDPRSTGFIVFEFKETENDSFGATPNTDGMTMLVPFGLFLKIYGDSCHYLAQKLSAIFRYPDSVVDLRNAGLYIENISKVNSLNEFINQTRWPRCDIEIDVVCRFDIALDNDPESGYANCVTQPIHVIKV